MRKIAVVDQNHEEAQEGTLPKLKDKDLDLSDYGTDLAAEIQEQFPLTVSMVNYGGREFYGGIDFTSENSGKGQLNFENGDITYCSQNNTMAVFYAQTENPDLTMEVQPIGKITSDLSVLEELPETAEMTFQIAK